MPAHLGGDYSKYPPAIQATFPYVAGSVVELHQTWAVYHRLFMEDQALTELMSKSLGGVLGLFQTALEEAMFLSIARLTDRDNRAQSNLSVWSLEVAVPFAKDSAFAAKVSTSLTDLLAAADDIRKHRHKRLAHFDFNVSLKTTTLPMVLFSELRSVMEKLEDYINLYSEEFGQTKIAFEYIRGHDLTGKAEVTVLKACAYDKLELAGTIPFNEWTIDQPA